METPELAESVKRWNAMRKAGQLVHPHNYSMLDDINALVQLVGEMSREVTDVVSTMSQCKRFESGVGGQTVEASLSRTYLHRVPLLCLHDLTETLTKAAPIAELAKQVLRSIGYVVTAQKYLSDSAKRIEP